MCTREGLKHYTCTFEHKVGGITHCVCVCVCVCVGVTFARLCSCPTREIWTDSPHVLSFYWDRYFCPLATQGSVWDMVCVCALVCVGVCVCVCVCLGLFLPLLLPYLVTCGHWGWVGGCGTTWSTHAHKHTHILTWAHAKVRNQLADNR